MRNRDPATDTIVCVLRSWNSMVISPAPPRMHWKMYQLLSPRIWMMPEGFLNSTVPRRGMNVPVPMAFFQSP